MSEPLATEDIFGLLRDLERASPGKPRIGKGLRASDDIVRFAHAPHLVFAPATAEYDGGSLAIPVLRVFFMGLIGPMGPLPQQWSELAIYERRYAKERPFGAFLDILANRMIQLFYRAWADAEPAANLGRPAGDLFQHYTGALGGLVDASAHEEPDRVRLALLGFAGQSAARRSPAAIADTVSAILGVPAEVVEFVGAWRDMDERDATRIGRSGAHAALGRGAILGTSVYTVQDACFVRLTFRDRALYTAHLPGTAGFRLALAVVGALVPAHLEWKLEFELARREAAGSRLGGGARLGWTSWIGGQADGPPRRDLRLGPAPGTGSNAQRAAA
jgi:type VI secretion system protein ImpH